jgi:tRNA(fMet)-specific endonuclease VapC
MGLILDTSLFVAAERSDVSFVELLGHDLRDETVAISAITASELLQGVHRGANARLRARRETIVERVLASVPIVPFDVVVARTHARVWAELAVKGKPLGAHDLLIAATALATGGRVVTRDLRSFPKVPGLVVLQR